MKRNNLLNCTIWNDSFSNDLGLETKLNTRNILITDPIIRTIYKYKYMNICYTLSDENVYADI